MHLRATGVILSETTWTSQSTSPVYGPLSDGAIGTFSIDVDQRTSPYTVVICGDIRKE